MKMLVSDLLPGMKLARSVYGVHGEVLLRTNVLLNNKYIDALKRHNIMAVYIENPLTSDFDAIEAEKALADEVKTQTLKTVKDWFDSPQAINFTKMTKSLAIVIDEILSGKVLTGSLAEISATDSYTFTHSVDVCLLSLNVGIKMGFNRSNLIKLGMGALLHDLGKTKVSPAVLHKPAKLTDEEYAEIKKHPVWSYQLLKEKAGDEISSISLAIALDHHERYDGRGYPRGLKGKEIGIMSAICAVCDVYNAMTTDRVYRKAIPVHETYEMIMGSGNILFNFEVVKAFLSCITPYPIGSLISTTAGDAYVIGTNSKLPFCPKIFLFRENRIVNLDEELSISITGLLSSKDKQKMFLEKQNKPTHFT